MAPLEPQRETPVRTCLSTMISRVGISRVGISRVGISRVGISRVGISRLILALLLVLHVGLVARVAAVNSPTLDEPAHLSSGMSHWKLGKFDQYRVNPPLVRLVASLPLLLTEFEFDWSYLRGDAYARPEFTTGNRFATISGFRIFKTVMLARWACLPFTLVGAWVCYRWATDLYGHWSGVCAASLWCFSPNVIAHAAQIMPDAGASAMGCLAGYAFWNWLRRPTWRTALLAGCALGLAGLTKTTWILLFGLWPILWLVWASRTSGLSHQLDHNHTKSAHSLSDDDGDRERLYSTRMVQLRQLASSLLLAVYLINLGYGFEGSFKRLGEYTFISGTLTGRDVNARIPGNRFADSWLALVPVPLPENYVRGVDVQRYDFERGKWSYLRGEQRFGGWWYYYLYALVVKVPIGTWLLGISAGLLTLRHERNWLRMRNELVLVVPAIAVLLLVSSQTGFNRYLRYVLPALPFAFIWISKVFNTFKPRRLASFGVPCVFLVYSVVSSLWVFPHSLSYFNELAGGPVRGHAHLLDGNVDWGQDLLQLRQWLDAHPQAKNVRVAYFGSVALTAVKIEADPPPKGPAATTALGNPRQAALLGPQPGWFAVSVNLLHGYRHSGFEEPRYTYLLNFQPKAMAGYSIHIYEISLEEANRVREELGLPLLVPKQVDRSS